MILFILTWFSRETNTNETLPYIKTKLQLRDEISLEDFQAQEHTSISPNAYFNSSLSLVPRFTQIGIDGDSTAMVDRSVGDGYFAHLEDCHALWDFQRIFQSYRLGAGN